MGDLTLDHRFLRSKGTHHERDVFAREKVVTPTYH